MRICSQFKACSQLLCSNLVAATAEGPCLDISYTRNRARVPDVALCLASFTQRDISKVHPHCSLCSYFIPLKGGPVRHRPDMQLLVYPLIDGWALSGLLWGCEQWCHEYARVSLPLYVCAHFSWAGLELVGVTAHL